MSWANSLLNASILWRTAVLDSQTEQIVRSHLSTKCNLGSTCQTCKNATNWVIHDLIGATVIPTPAKPPLNLLGAGVFAMLPVSCQKCGSLFLFHAHDVGIKF